MSVPGADVRPGGRAARVRAALLDAAAEALVDGGPSGIDLAELARRAGIGKTTVYRRWGTVAAVVNDLVADMAETSLPRVDTGTLDGDLAANADLVRSTLADPRQGRLFAALVASATADPGTAEALRGFYDRRIATWSPCVMDAVERGGASRDRSLRGRPRGVRAAVLPVAHPGRGAHQGRRAPRRAGGGRGGARRGLRGVGVLGDQLVSARPRNATARG